jgi:hypothetical protein
MQKHLSKFEFMIVLFNIFYDNPFSSSAMVDVYECLTGKRNYFSAEIALWRYENIDLKGFYLKNTEKGTYQFIKQKLFQKKHINMCYSCSGVFHNKIEFIPDEYYQKMTDKTRNLVNGLEYRLIREFLPKNDSECIGTYYLRITGDKNDISRFYFKSDLRQVFVMIYDGKNETELRDIPNDFIERGIYVPNEFLMD